MNTKKDIPQNYISQFAKKATLLKDNVNFLALGEQKIINTQTPNKKNSSNNGEIDKEFEKEYLEKKQQQLTTYIIANSYELRRILDHKAITDDFENYGRE